VSGVRQELAGFSTRCTQEGQRRYVETFSPYARPVPGPDGPPPRSTGSTAYRRPIAIDQTNPVRHLAQHGSGTMTEINDHLKLLFARAAGRLHCSRLRQARCGGDSPQYVVDEADPALRTAERCAN